MNHIIKGECLAILIFVFKNLFCIEHKRKRGVKAIESDDSDSEKSVSLASLKKKSKNNCRSLEVGAVADSKGHQQMQTFTTNLAIAYNGQQNRN